MKKIYLAIPYSGMEESSYEQANIATAGIISANQELNVFSPITHSHPLTKTEFTVPGSWDYWSKIDYEFIDWADEVWVVIPEEGYDKVQNSTGVQAEIKYAESHDKPVIQASSNLLMRRARKLRLNEL